MKNYKITGTSHVPISYFFIIHNARTKFMLQQKLNLFLGEFFWLLDTHFLACPRASFNVSRDKAKVRRTLLNKARRRHARQHTKQLLPRYTWLPLYKISPSANSLEREAGAYTCVLDTHNFLGNQPGRKLNQSTRSNDFAYFSTLIG